MSILLGSVTDLGLRLFATRRKIRRQRSTERPAVTARGRPFLLDRSERNDVQLGHSCVFVDLDKSL